MTFLTRRILALALLAHLLVASASMADVVISQVYGGGGASTGSPAYTNDYVELFNRGSSAADISGYSLQYGSAAGNFGRQIPDSQARTNWYSRRDIHLGFDNHQPQYVCGQRQGRFREHLDRTWLWCDGFAVHTPRRAHSRLSLLWRSE
jgi:opacity protein-like surface antigen